MRGWRGWPRPACRAWQPQHIQQTSTRVLGLHPEELGGEEDVKG